MSRRVAIVGGGVAGFGAALAASEAGADVTLVRGGAGATSLGVGAFDDEPWDLVERACRVLGHAPTVSLSPELRAALGRLDYVTMGEEGAPAPRLAVTSGITRSALAHDAALLDLQRVAGRTVLVLAADRDGWDERSIARCLAEAHPEASFEAARLSVLRFDDEHRISDADLAARHDDPDRRAWLAGRLAEVVARYGKESVAFLVGPWLGIERGHAAELSARLGCPIGEAISVSSPTPGLRWEAGRDRALARLEVKVERGYATSVVAAKRGVTVALDGDRTLEVDAAVYALGGLASGGLIYDPPEHGAGFDGPSGVRPPFRVALRGLAWPVRWGVTSGLISSTLGPVLDASAWPHGEQPGALERVGAVAPPGERKNLPAGDFAFGERRTLLGALRSGMVAGLKAASDA